MPFSQSIVPTDSITSDLWASSSSSDEYTSDSDSDSPIPPRPRIAHSRAEDFTWTKRAVEVDRTPRRLRKARECLAHSLRCALVLAHRHCPGDLDDRGRKFYLGKSPLNGISSPWADLAERIVLLKGYAEDTKVSNKAFRACLDLFVHLCSAHVIPLTRDRSYTRDELSRSEAKHIAGFVKHFQDLFEINVAVEDPQQLDVIWNCPTEILVRVIALALPTAQKAFGTLDLSKLACAHPQLALDTVNPHFGPILNAFGLCSDDITVLDLSNNDLDHLPRSIASMRHIETLRISGNTKLEWFPLSLLKLEHLRRIQADQVPATTLTGPIKLSGPLRDICERRMCSRERTRASAQRIGVRSLVDITVIKAMTAFESDSTFWELVNSLAPHLRGTMKAAIRCEWCENFSVGFAGSLVLRCDLTSASGTNNRAAFINFKGDVCGPCRRILNSSPSR